MKSNLYIQKEKIYAYVHYKDIMTVMWWRNDIVCPNAPIDSACGNIIDIPVAQWPIFRMGQPILNTQKKAR